jgi:hypothetical protein
MFKPEFHRIPPKAVSCSTALFGLAGCFVGIAPEGGAGLGDEFWVAAFDEVAGFGDDVFQNVCKVPDDCTDAPPKQLFPQ